MEIGFGILGQTALLMHGNVVVNAASPRLLQVLAALLTAPGRRIPVSGMVEWVWSEQEKAPLDPLATLHQYGLRLRQLFAEKGIPAGVGVSKAGCMLQVDPASIDYRQLQAMMARARTYADRGDHDRAHVEALAALRLCRDEPLVDLRTARADQWRTRWARNDWVPANAFVAAQQLLLGQAELAVARLEEVDGAHPMELSLATLRVRALLAAGRGLDATEYFRRMRAEFQRCGDFGAADELLAVYNEAIKPGSRSAFPAPARAGATVAPDVSTEVSGRGPGEMGPVRHLPPDAETVVGREGTVAELDAFTTDSAGQSRPVVVMVTGAPGAGKSTVVVRWAHRAAGRYPQGVVLLDLRGDGQTAGMTAADVVETLLELLDVAVDQIVSPVARAARLTRLLRGRRLLVVLDNVARTEQVAPLLPVLVGCTVVLVTRQRLSTLLAAHTIPVVTVGPLSQEAAQALLQRRVGLRAQQDREGAARLMRLCQGHALALTLVANRAAARAGMRLVTLAEALRDADMLLDLGDDGDWPGRSLRSAFTLSYQSLGAAEQRVFALLGLHPGIEMSSEAIAAADGRGLSAVRRSLDVLVAAHLIEHPGDMDRYRMLDLLQMYARSLAAQLPDFVVVRRRMLEFYLLSAFRGHELVFPGRDRPALPAISDGIAPTVFATAAAARQWFLRERATLTAVVAVAARAGLNDLVFVLPSLTADVFDQYGHYHDIISGFGIAASTAAEVGNGYAEASALNDLGQVLLLMGQDTQAEQYLTMALRLVDEHDIGIGRVTVLMNLARRHLHAGRTEQAVEMSGEALRAARSLGEPERCAAALHRHADALLEQGGHQLEALDLYREALAVRERINDVPGRILTHIALGDLLRRLERFDDAEEQCRRAAALADRSQHLPAVMKLNTVLARLRHAQGDDRLALQHAHRAVELADRTAHATGRGRALDTLAEILLGTGNIDDARVLWERAAQLFRDRERLGQAARIEAVLSELDAGWVPLAREGERDTVAIPSPRVGGLGDV
ncbi:AfsR/SARP family transcriptional regulator [Amycolatopsis nalaikhensis]|uniref:Tetratricopeptide repeat protein n=1 Tax=Amycolatopsis nalaikhensis TaxID=715472 RepID=A0ABY8X932_9PSEU|nr:tetratricopeptide repeat protein [Amycolatopsis sp. 2-2]WIV52888.1 tetratricopeptide repeat protein [Amycolatopsis sp. 2-2]